MTSGLPGPTGSAPDDTHLGRLLAEGLDRDLSGPVDEHRLLAQARRGAVRIRRRRTAALGVAATLVIGVPLGFTAAARLAGQGEAVTASSADTAERAAAAREAASPAVGAASTMAQPSAADGGMAGGSAPAVAVPSPTAPQVAPSPEAASSTRALRATAGAPTATLPRTTSGQVVVPEAALLTGTDLPRAGLRATEDSANLTPAPATVAMESCGTALTDLPEAVGSRVSEYQQSGRAPDSRWILGSTVRVFAGTGASRYLAAAARLDCVAPVTMPAGAQALLGRAHPDPQGRTRWYGVVRVGRVVSEVRLVAPGEAASAADDATRLLRTARERLVASGLAPAAAADPDLS